MQDSFDARMQGQTPETVAKPKSSKLWIIICAVLLIGIVALAVTEVLAYQEISKRDDKITELEKKVDELQKPAEEEEKPVDEIEVDDGNVDADNVEDKDGGKDVSDSDGATYIKFSAAGMKIKIPNTLKSVNYNISNAGKSIIVWAVPAGFQYYPDFADPKKNTSGMVAIEISKKISNKSQACNSGNIPDGVICTGTYVTDAAVKGYEILYEGPHAVYSKDATGAKDESKAEQELIKVISDKNNYSAL